MSPSHSEQHGLSQDPLSIPPIPRRDTNQTILTLGLELEFLLLNLLVQDDPHAILKTALESHGQVPFPYDPSFSNLEINQTFLPEIRCDIRLDKVVWFPHGKSIEKITWGFGNTPITRTLHRYNRKHFALMNESGLDPKRDRGSIGPVQELLDTGEVRNRQSMEVATPIMREHSWRRVVSALLASLKALSRSRLDVVFNKDTGLHVHVGRRGGWSVCQLKKILKAVVVFEEAMDTQHPASRVRSDVDQKVVNISSNIEMMKIRPMAKLERVRYVDSKINSRTARTRSEGVMRVYMLSNGSNKCTKYNFLSAKESGTVEFRQGIASLDWNQVGCWVDVVLDFVSAAITTTRVDFEQWAGDMDDPDHDMLSVLDSFLTHGREYRFRSENWSGDFEDELLEMNEVEESQHGVQYYEDTYFPEERSVPDRKGKGVATATRQLKDNYEESGRGRNKKGAGESSEAGAQYHKDTIGTMSSQA